MWYLMLCVILLIAWWIISLKVADDWEDILMWGFLGSVSLVFILFFLGFFFIPATTGLVPHYSQGERTGYITKLAYKGLIWKTWEGEMQMGVGQMASLQEPFKFSVVNETILKEVESHLGTEHKILLHYNQWGMMPFMLGESGYEITGVEQLN